MGVWKLVRNDELSKHVIAISSFKHENGHTLSFRIGDRLEVTGECEEWYRDCLLSKPNKYGIFPKSFVKAYNPKQLAHSKSSVNEIESVLREWTSVWFKKYEECEKRKITHCLMGCFKNILNLKNVIVENRASIDEIKELKKSTIGKILQGNSLLELDVIGFDASYNRLDTTEATTMLLFKELQKNSEYKNQSSQAPGKADSQTVEDQPIETSLSHFSHRTSVTSVNQGVSSARSSGTYCLKLSLEQLMPSQNCAYPEENSELCLNLFLYRENTPPEYSYYLCENATFLMSQLSQRTVSSSSNNINSQQSGASLNGGASAATAAASAAASASGISLIGTKTPAKFALFCDISEKDFEMTKCGYRLYLVAYAVKQLKANANDRHASISRVFAAGIYDLGANLCNLIYVNTDVRHIQSTMLLSVSELEQSPVSAKLLQELINTNRGSTAGMGVVSSAAASTASSSSLSSAAAAASSGACDNHQSSCSNGVSNSSASDSFRQGRLASNAATSSGAGSGSAAASSKNAYLTLTFRCELLELTYRAAHDKYGHMMPRVCRKMDFPEIIMPDDFRNDFYVTVLGGELQKARNYEFVVNLVQFREEYGRLVETPMDFGLDELEQQQQQSSTITDNAMATSASSAAATAASANNTASNASAKRQHQQRSTFFYKSIVYAKQDKPKWNEVVHVSIPHGKKVEEIKKTYLRFLLRNRSLDGKDKTKMVGTFYLQLTNEDGSAIQDTRCFLPMNKLDSDADTNTSLDGYFYPLRTLPAFLANMGGGGRGAASAAAAATTSTAAPPMLISSDKLKDFIDVRVKVVSTQLTQNVTLLNLLSFPTEARPDPERYAALLTYLDELLAMKKEQSAEIVKFLQAILDKLIDILLDLRTKHTKQHAAAGDAADATSSISERAYEMHARLIQMRVFEILVAIFQIVENQNKFASFRTVIDAYLAKNFCITLAHRPLLRIFSELMSAVYEKYAPISHSQQLLLLLDGTGGGGGGSPMHSATRQRQSVNSSSFSGSNSNNYALQGSSDPDNANGSDNDLVTNTIKSMEYIFKFAFRSRELFAMYNRANNPQSDLKNDTFDADIAHIFRQLNDITALKSVAGSSAAALSGDNAASSSSSSSSVALTRVQLFILNRSISLLPILVQSKRYSMQRIAEFYIGFMSNQFVLYTHFLSKLIRTRLFEEQESRRVIMEPLCRALTGLLLVENTNDEKNKIDSKLEKVGIVLVELMEVLERQRQLATAVGSIGGNSGGASGGAIGADVNELCARLLLPLTHVFLFVRAQTKPRQLYASILVAIVRNMDSPAHFDTFFEAAAQITPSLTHLSQNTLLANYSLIDETVTRDVMHLKQVSSISSSTPADNATVGQLVLIKLIYTVQCLLDAATFPADWFDLLILRDSVLLGALYHIAERINRSHNTDHFGRLNQQIWRDYFSCMVQLSTDACLQLERCNENKRRTTLAKYRDLRVKAALEINTLMPAYGAFWHVARKT